MLLKQIFSIGIKRWLFICRRFCPPDLSSGNGDIVEETLRDIIRSSVFDVLENQRTPSRKMHPHYLFIMRSLRHNSCRIFSKYLRQDLFLKAFLYFGRVLAGVEDIQDRDVFFSHFVDYFIAPL